MVKVCVVFYSLYGHNFVMAKHAVRGAEKVAGAEVSLRRVKETLSDDILIKMNAQDHHKEWDHVPIVTPQDIEECDVAIFLTPTRFGNICSQMKSFIDSLGSGWVKDKFVGKMAGVMTSSNTAHGGQETTIICFHICLMHLGFVVGGLPYSFKDQIPSEHNGCSPYGASTIAGSKQNLEPTDVDVRGAEYQAEYLTRLGSRLAVK